MAPRYLRLEPAVRALQLACWLLVLASSASESCDSEGDHSAYRSSPYHRGALQPDGCKEIHFIRHAQGTHNEAEERAEREGLYADGADILLEANSGTEYWDPRLTQKGVAQCKQLSKDFPVLDPPLELVVVSPFYRTLQTAMLAIPSLSKKGDAPKLLVTELCRERIHHYMCDTHKVGFAPHSLAHTPFFSPHYSTPRFINAAVGGATTRISPSRLHWPEYHRE
jgi:hypothetical protein